MVLKTYIASVGVTPRIFPTFTIAQKQEELESSSSVMVVPNMTFMHSEYP